MSGTPVTAVGGPAAPVPAPGTEPRAERAPAAALFSCSARLSLLEHFRIPYRIQVARARDDGVETLSGIAGGPALHWPGRLSVAEVAAAVTGGGLREPVPIFGGVLGDGAVKPLLQACGGEWHGTHLIRGSEGAELGRIWRSDEGGVFLPFHPDEVIMNFLSERYLRIAGGDRAALRHLVMKAYYLARPLVARRVQIALRRQFARMRSRSHSGFPRWPVETCLHDFLDLMLGLLASVAGEPVPTIAPWPDGRTWALVLTHDVERAAGWEAVQPVLDLERRFGMRSSWNLVPERDYLVTEEQVRELREGGAEIGVHGLRHDGRDMVSLATWQTRLKQIRAAAERWGAVGYASPAMHRRWEWMPMTALEYDRSYPDTDPYEPQPGGCCSWLPFFNEELVELPLTMPQDHTLFMILRRRDGAATWIEKARVLRDRGGMALIDTHPDYLLDREVFAAYEGFLGEFASDEGAWKALPREVASWWRRRAASSLEREGEGWQVVGPAAGEARVALHGGSR